MFIIKPEALLQLEKLVDKFVLHDTPVGKVSFVIPTEPLTKSYVEAHYRHGKDGELIFVNAYHNKKYAKPEELTASALHSNKESLQPNAKPIDAPDQKLNSFHYGDEVFVKYSHMHDQHFLVGAVIGIRDDKNHAGKLVAVRLLNGKAEWYAPSSLVHVHKQGHEHRKHEVSHHTDTSGKTIDYQHLNPSQRQKFYDLYKLWFRLQRMGEMHAFKTHFPEFKNDADGSYPKLKSDLTAEQKIKLEQYNKFPVVPYEALIAAVGQEGYDDGKHSAMVKKLIQDIEDFKKQGAPNVEFPKFKKPKSKKENPYVPPEWMSGMFPSVATDEKIDPEELSKLQEDIANVTGITESAPSTQGKTYGNSSDFYYGQPIVHGSVIEAKPEGTVYEPAPVIPTPEQEKDVNFADLFNQIVQSTTEAPAEKKKTITPVVPAEKKPTTKPPVAAKPAAGAKPEKATSAAKETKPAPKLVIPAEVGEEKDISDLDFKVVGFANNMGFGGAHSKYVLEAGDGHQYLFKPYKQQEVHRIWADIIAAKTAKALGLATAEMGSKPVTIKVPMSMGGSYQGMNATGSVQRIIPKLKSNNIAHFVNTGFKTAPKEVVEQLQKEHVLDWLLGNNDAHFNQFIVDENGKLCGIDKGMSFKFYKDDKLSLTWDPQGNKDYIDPQHNLSHEQIYSVLLKAAKKGDVKLDWGVVHQFIEENVSKLSALAWVKMVTPYAMHSVEWANKSMQFQELASKRKSNLLFDFKKLYAACGIATEYNKEAKKYVQSPIQPKEKLPETDTFQPDAYQQIDLHFHNKVLKAGPHGHSIMIGGGDIEDMNVSFTPYEWEQEAVNDPDHHGKGMEVSFKVLAGSEPKMIKYFDTVKDQTVQYKNVDSTLPTAHDPLSAIVISAAKTINHHAPNGGSNPDGLYNPDKVNAFAEWFQNAEEFDPDKPIVSVEELALKLNKKYITQNAYDDPLTISHQVAKHYHDLAKQVIEAAQKKAKIQDAIGNTKKLMGWSGPYKIKETAVSDKNHPWATWPKFFIDDNGQLKRSKGDHLATHTHGGANYGCMFTKHLDGDISIHYYPHYSQSLISQNNHRSQQGMCLIDFKNWNGDVEAMHKARQVMKEMGVDHRLATHADAECLYLTRIAWHNKGNVGAKGKQFNTIMAMENSPEKVEKLKKFCASIYDGVSPDSLSTYSPIPKWDAESGSHYFLNPYILEHLKNNPPKVKVLYHALCGGTDEEKIKSIVEHGIVSTELRRKFGWPIYGQSSQADQNTGGASYVFMRGTSQPSSDIMKGMDASYLVFRPELLARTDCFGYYHDNYGSTSSGYSDGHKSIDTRIPAMEMTTSDKPITEVMFKNRVPLETWFVGMTGGGGAYGDTWIKKFKNYIKKLKPHIFNHAQFGGIKD
jgi:hypothetical protein